MMLPRAVILILAVMQAAAPVRMLPLADRDLTPHDRDLIASYVRGGQATNDVRTLLRHPDSLPGVMPFWNYVAFESTLPPRDRATLMLRTAWRARSTYLWARYASTASLGAEELRAIASADPGRSADAFDAVLLRTADGLHERAFVDDDTWKALEARYGTERLMDAVFTVAETSMLAAIVNTLRVPIDAAFTARPPAAAPAPGASRDHPVLAAPRIPPLEPTFWTGELRVLLDPDATGREIAAVYRTFAQHPALYRPRQELSEYIRVKSTLPPRLRELAILRIGYRCRSEYEWAAHVRAGLAAGLSRDEVRRIAVRSRAGWTGSDAAVLQAVDELFEDDAVSDSTWARLTAVLDQRQVIDLLITAGGYRMVSMALNTFGVPLEPGSERFPE